MTQCTSVHKSKESATNANAKSSIMKSLAMNASTIQRPVPWVTQHMKIFKSTLLAYFWVDIIARLIKSL